ncbi:MAG: tyrosine-type recombinase/integrase [Proteobacteria bacterium]|nr:tyrosine-type recombinase/integrase [Pseudomonadota bacterium]
MNRQRGTSRTLTGSRIYIRRGKYQYYSPVPLVNPATGKATKWHPLCKVEEGELKARTLLDALINRRNEEPDDGDFLIWFRKWKTKIGEKRTKDTPTDPARAQVWETGGKALMSALGVVEEAFRKSNLAEITPSIVATFVDQWEGRRSAQAYRGHLTKFFAWCCRKGLMNTNPAREVTVEAPPQRDVYITDEQYTAIRNACLVGKDGRPTRTGEMIQCYMDLLYLMYQRGTEIRLLKWSDVKDDGILFKPTKTEKSSGTKVLVPVGADVKTVLAKLKRIRKINSMYVIHTEHGQPYTAHGIGSLFERACERAKVEGVTLKDIRAKAATDASNSGYTDEQIKTALAHTDVSTTRKYIRSRQTPASEVQMQLPPGTKSSG